MLEFSSDIKIISSYKKESKPYGKVKNRPTHGYIFRIKGSAHYKFEGCEITLNEGEFIFIPKDSSYEYRTYGEECTYTSINFLFSDAPTSPAVYKFDVFHDISHITENFSECFTFGDTSDKYKCLSIFYDLLSSISRYENLSYGEGRKYALIEPAIEYLKSHIYDKALKINKLHRLCGISDTYFRKVFTLIFNKTPQEYVLEERIQHAKAIIESGDYSSIAEVAESVGYNDPLSFSKAFKKVLGCPPTYLNK